MPPAARLGDMHVCPMQTPAVVPIPHVGGPIIPPCALTVLIGNMPAARITDMCICVGPPDVIVKGSMGVYIMGLNSARIGDNTAHGGVIVQGWPTVIIGEIGSGVGGGSTPAMPGMPKMPSIAPPEMPEIPSIDTDLLADLAQTTFDITGIVDPTPVSDALSGIMSIVRGDGMGALISAASMIPYVGDLAKLGKLPKLARTVDKAVAAIKAAPNSAFAKRAKPLLNALNEALKKLPTDSLPQPAQEALAKIGRSVSEIAPAVAKLNRVTLKRLDDFKAISKNPEPNTLYEFRGKTYQTDHLGRPVSSSGKLTRGKGGNRHSVDSKIGKQGKPDDIGFHLGGDQFGFQGGRLNIVPGNKVLNLKEYAAVERELAQLAKKHNVRAEFRAIYDDDSIRPTRFEIEYTVDGGPPHAREFRNTGGD